MTALQPIDLKPYVDILRRHWRVAVGVLILGLAIASSLAVMLPNVYEASTLLVVQPPEVTPEDIQRTPGTLSGEARGINVMERLEKLSQEAFTDARLEGLIDRYRLYHGDGSPSSETLIGAMRKHIRLTVPERSFNYENVKRQKEERGANLLEIAFLYSDPVTARLVVADLTNIFIQESLAERMRAAENEVLFLGQRVAEAEHRLDGKEEELRQLKKHYSGSLPEQLPENIAELARLEADLRSVTDRITMAQASAQTNTQSSPEAKLQALQIELADLRSQYKDDYPDIVETRREIQELTEQIAREPRGRRSDFAIVPRSPAEQLQAEAEGLRSQIALLKQKISETPLREQELSSMTRDRDVLAQHYHDLRNSELEAKLNESLVKEREGQRIQIIEPPHVSRTPVSPNRPAIVLLGSVLSILATFAVPFALYFTDTSFREADELRQQFGIPVAGTVPWISRDNSAISGNTIALMTAASIVLAILAGTVFRYKSLLF